MNHIRELTENYDLNYDYMFRVFFMDPGLVRIELDDEGPWTVADILSLPEWMIV